MLDINKRVFSGSCVPLATPLGKLLINSKEGKEISKGIRKLKKGETFTIKLSEETKLKIEELKNNINQ
jgi:hypothetical protein